VNKPAPISGIAEKGAAVADEDHIRRLKQGVDAWNRWRRDSLAHLRDVDLHAANLMGADLSGADLSGVDLLDLREGELRDANLGANMPGLFGVVFHGVNLIGTNLIDTDLSGADLRDANLFRADLSGAELRGAKMIGANLSAANLRGANLSGADLTMAFLGETFFADTALTNVIGLEKCDHRGPSVVDHRTLQKSGPLPLSFLRGVGLPDNLIEYLPSLLNQAIQHYSCFISYSTKDQEFADRLHADLQNKGVRCWFAPHDLPIGAKTWDAIDAAIKLRDKLLLILSENSINSDWVEDEVQKAFAEERERKQPILFPLRIDDAVRNTPEPWARKLWDQRNIGDFTGWKDHDAYKASFERVVRDLTIKPVP
jgi:TIR domain/Pentapeptide repeats (8 copies)